MSKHVLFIFEGEKAEPQILENLKAHFFSRSDKVIIHTVYGTVIYGLWKELKEDVFGELNLLDLLRERHCHNIEVLNGLDIDDISQIYLFFDYDGHTTNAADYKLDEMLKMFCDETDKGKLFISYPMVEALKDLHSSEQFEANFAPAKNKDNKRYKKKVNKDATIIKHINEIKLSGWEFITTENLKKANFIINDVYTSTSELFEPFEIFDCQLKKYIEPENKVAVLSAFPLFLRDYFGYEKLGEILSGG